MTTSVIRSPDVWGQPTFHSVRWRVLRSGRPREPEREARAGLSYAAGLDGLRAVAVAAVVVYHVHGSWLPGGFLGVDVFFVLSGFLITSLLLAEWCADGRIDLRRFYLRRARRLLPALFAMIAAVALATAVAAPSELARLRGDVGAAMTYSTNWTQIAWDRSYFAQLGRPSLLQHLWSLAVEEQFYVLWPLILLACLTSRRRSAVLLVPIGGICLSTLLMAVLFHPGQDPSRVYYGSDTHAASMLVGAVLGVIVLRRRTAGRPNRTSGRWVADAFALTGIVVLGSFVVRADYYTDALYRGGYLVVALAAATLVYAVARRDTMTARILGAAAARWIGQRSYAIYLWHWPILMLTRPGLDVPDFGWTLDVPRVAAIVIVAHFSYRFIERPIRTWGFMAVALGTAGASAGRADPDRRAPSRSTAVRPALVGSTLAGIGCLVFVALASSANAVRSSAVDRSRALTIAVPSDPQSRTSFPRPVRVSFFGDSQGMTLLLNKPDGLRSLLTVSDSTVEGCGVLLGQITSRAGYRRDLSRECAGWRESWSAAANRTRPQIAVIEIGAWDVFDDTVNGVKLRFGTPAWDSYFDQQLNEGVHALIASGAQVSLMGVPCYRPIAAGGLPVLPERGENGRTRHLNVLLAAAAAKDPSHVFLIEPPSQFCTDPKIASSTSYRWDGVHYYKPGAALTFQAITPQLLAIPRP